MLLLFLIMVVLASAGDTKHSTFSVLPHNATTFQITMSTKDANTVVKNSDNTQWSITTSGVPGAAQTINMQQCLPYHVSLPGRLSDTQTVELGEHPPYFYYHSNTWRGKNDQKNSEVYPGRTNYYKTTTYIRWPGCSRTYFHQFPGVKRMSMIEPYTTLSVAINTCDALCTTYAQFGITGFVHKETSDHPDLGFECICAAGFTSNVASSADGIDQPTVTAEQCVTPLPGDLKQVYYAWHQRGKFIEPGKPVDISEGAESLTSAVVAWYRYKNSTANTTLDQSVASNRKLLDDFRWEGECDVLADIKLLLNEGVVKSSIRIEDIIDLCPPCKHHTIYACAVRKLTSRKALSPPSRTKSLDIVNSRLVNSLLSNTYDDIGCDQLLGKRGTPCLKTKKSTDMNTCKTFGLEMVIPRSKDHWKMLLSRYGASYFTAVPGIIFNSSTTSSTTSEQLSEQIMNSQSTTWFQAIDAGEWWLRDTVIGSEWELEPNCWMHLTNSIEGRPFIDVHNLQFSFQCKETQKYVCSRNKQKNRNRNGDVINNINTTAAATRIAISGMNLYINPPKQDGRLSIEGNFQAWGVSEKILQHGIDIWCYVNSSVSEYQYQNEPDQNMWSVVYHRRLNTKSIQRIYDTSQDGDSQAQTDVTNGARGFGENFHFKFDYELGHSCSVGAHQMQCTVITLPSKCEDRPDTTEDFRRRTLLNDGSIVLSCSEDQSVTVTTVVSPPFSCQPTQFSRAKSRKMSLDPFSVFQFQHFRFAIEHNNVSNANTARSLEYLSDNVWLATPTDVRNALSLLNSNNENITVTMIDVAVMDDMFVDTVLTRPTIASLGSELQNPRMGMTSPISLNPPVTHAFVAAHKGSWYAVHLRDKPYEPAFVSWEGSIKLSLPTGLADSSDDLGIYISNTLPHTDPNRHARVNNGRVYKCSFDTDDPCLLNPRGSNHMWWSAIVPGKRNTNPRGDNAIVWYDTDTTKMRSDIRSILNSETLPSSSFPSDSKKGLTASFWIGFVDGHVPKGLTIFKFASSDGSKYVRVSTHPVLPASFVFEVRTGGTFSAMFQTSSDAFSSQQWSHCVFVLSGIGDIFVYVNGKAIDGKFTGSNRLLQHVAMQSNAISLRTLTLWYTDGARELVPSSAFGHEDLRSSKGISLNSAPHWFEVWEVNKMVDFVVTVTGSSCSVYITTTTERPASDTEADTFFDVVNGETVSNELPYRINEDTNTVYIGVKPNQVGEEELECEYKLAVSSGVLRATHDRVTLDIAGGQVLSAVSVKGRALQTSVRGPLTASIIDTGCTQNNNEDSSSCAQSHDAIVLSYPGTRLTQRNGLNGTYSAAKDHGSFTFDSDSASESFVAPLTTNGLSICHWVKVNNSDATNTFSGIVLESESGAAKCMKNSWGVVKCGIVFHVGTSISNSRRLHDVDSSIISCEIELNPAEASWSDTFRVRVELGEPRNTKDIVIQRTDSLDKGWGQDLFLFCYNTRKNPDILSIQTAGTQFGVEFPVHESVSLLNQKLDPACKSNKFYKHPGEEQDRNSENLLFGYNSFCQPKLENYQPKCSDGKCAPKFVSFCWSVEACKSRVRTDYPDASGIQISFSHIVKSVKIHEIDMFEAIHGSDDVEDVWNSSLWSVNGKFALACNNNMLFHGIHVAYNGTCALAIESSATIDIESLHVNATANMLTEQNSFDYLCFALNASANVHLLLETDVAQVKLEKTIMTTENSANIWKWRCVNMQQIANQNEYCSSNSNVENPCSDVRKITFSSVSPFLLDSLVMSNSTLADSRHECSAVSNMVGFKQKTSDNSNIMSTLIDDEAALWDFDTVLDGTRSHNEGNVVAILPGYKEAVIADSEDHPSAHLKSGHWHHICASVNVADQSSFLMIDGKQAASVQVKKMNLKRTFRSIVGKSPVSPWTAAKAAAGGTHECYGMWRTVTTVEHDRFAGGFSSDGKFLCPKTMTCECQTWLLHGVDLHPDNRYALTGALDSLNIFFKALTPEEARTHAGAPTETLSWLLGPTIQLQDYLYKSFQDNDVAAAAVPFINRTRTYMTFPWNRYYRTISGQVCQNRVISSWRYCMSDPPKYGNDNYYLSGENYQGCIGAGRAACDAQKTGVCSGFMVAWAPSNKYLNGAAVPKMASHGATIRGLRMELSIPQPALSSIVIRFEYKWPNSTWSNLNGVNIQCVHLGASIEPQVIFQTTDTMDEQLQLHHWIEHSFSYDGFLKWDAEQHVIRCSVQDRADENDRITRFRAGDISSNGGLSTHAYANIDLEFQCSPVRVLCSDSTVSNVLQLRHLVASSFRRNLETSIIQASQEVIAHSWSIGANLITADLEQSLTFKTPTLVKGVIVAGLCDAASNAASSMLQLSFTPVLNANVNSPQLTTTFELLANCDANEYLLDNPLYATSVSLSIIGSANTEGWQRQCYDCVPEQQWSKQDALNFSYVPYCIPINRTRWKIESFNKTRWKVQFNNRTMYDNGTMFWHNIGTMNSTNSTNQTAINTTFFEPFNVNTSYTQLECNYTSVRVGETNISSYECKRRCEKKASCYGIHWGDSLATGCFLLDYPGIDSGSSEDSAQFGVRFVSYITHQHRAARQSEIYTFSRVHRGLQRIDFIIHSNTGFGTLSTFTFTKPNAVSIDKSWGSSSTASSELLPPLRDLLAVNAGSSEMIVDVADGFGDMSAPWGAATVKATYDASLEGFVPIPLETGFVSGYQSSLDDLLLYEVSLNTSAVADLYRSYPRAVRPSVRPDGHIMCDQISTTAPSATAFATINFRCQSTSPVKYIVVDSVATKLQIQHLQVFAEVNRLATINVEVLGNVQTLRLEPAVTVSDSSISCRKLEPVLLNSKITNVISTSSSKAPRLCENIFKTRPKSLPDFPFRFQACYESTILSKSFGIFTAPNTIIADDQGFIDVPMRCYTYCRDVYRRPYFAINIVQAQSGNFPSCLCGSSLKDFTGGRVITCKPLQNQLVVFTPSYVLNNSMPQEVDTPAPALEQQDSSWFCDYKNSVILADDDCDGDGIKDRVCVYWEQIKQRRSYNDRLVREPNIQLVFALRTRIWMSTRSTECATSDVPVNYTFSGKETRSRIVITPFSSTANGLSTAGIYTLNSASSSSSGGKFRNYAMRCGVGDKILPAALNTPWSIVSNVNAFDRRINSLGNFDPHCHEIAGNFGNYSITRMNTSFVKIMDVINLNHSNPIFAKVNGFCQGYTKEDHLVRHFKYDVRSCSLVWQSDGKISNDTIVWNKDKCNQLEYVGCFRDSNITVLFDKIIEHTDCETQHSCSKKCQGYTFFGIGQSFELAFSADAASSCSSSQSDQYSAAVKSFTCSQCYCANTINFMEHGSRSDDKCTYATKRGNGLQGSGAIGCSGISSRTGDGGKGYFSVYKQKSIAQSSSTLVKNSLHYTNEETWPVVDPYTIDVAGHVYAGTTLAKATTFGRPSILRSVVGPVDLAGLWRLTRTFDMPNSGALIPTEFTFSMKLWFFGVWPRARRNKNLIVMIAGQVVWSLGGDLLCTSEASSRWDGRVASSRWNWNLDLQSNDICYSYVNFTSVTIADVVEIQVQVVGKTSGVAYVAVSDETMVIGHKKLSTISTAKNVRVEHDVDTNKFFVTSDGAAQQAQKQPFTISAKTTSIEGVSEPAMLYGTTSNVPATPVFLSLLHLTANSLEITVHVATSSADSPAPLPALLKVSFTTCSDVLGCLISPTSIDLTPTWSKMPSNPSLQVAVVNLDLLSLQDSASITKVWLQCCNHFYACSTKLSKWVTLLTEKVDGSMLTYNTTSLTGEMSVKYKSVSETNSNTNSIVPTTHELKWSVPKSKRLFNTLSAFVGCFNTSFLTWVRVIDDSDPEDNEESNANDIHWSAIASSTPSTISCVSACKAHGYVLMALDVHGCRCSSVLDIVKLRDSQVSDNSCLPVCNFEKTKTPVRYCGNDGNTAMWRVDVLSTFTNEVGQSRYGFTDDNYNVICHNGGYLVHSTARVVDRLKIFQECKKRSATEPQVSFLCAQTDHFFCAKYDELYGWMYQSPLKWDSFEPEESDTIVATVPFPVSSSSSHTPFAEVVSAAGESAMIGNPPIQFGYPKGNGDLTVKWSRRTVAGILDNRYQFCHVASVGSSASNSVRAPCLVVSGHGFNRDSSTGIQYMYKGEASTKSIRKNTIIVHQQSVPSSATEVRSGTCLSHYVDTRSCTRAARSLGYSMDATSESSNLFPPGCYIYRSSSKKQPQVYFNKFLSSSVACSSSPIRICICSSLPTIPDLLGPVDVQSSSRSCVSRLTKSVSSRSPLNEYPPLCTEWQHETATGVEIPPQIPRDLNVVKTLFLPNNALLQWRPPTFWGSGALSSNVTRSFEIELERLNSTSPPPFCLAEFNDGSCDNRGLQSPTIRKQAVMCRSGSLQSNSVFAMCGCESNFCTATAISSDFLASASVIIGDLFPQTKYKFRIRSVVYSSVDKSDPQLLLSETPYFTSKWTPWEHYVTGRGSAPSAPPRPSVVSAGFFSVDFEIHRAAWNGIPVSHYLFELAKDTACDSLQNLEWYKIQAVKVPCNSSFEPSIIFKRGERDKGGIGPALVAGTSYFYRVAAVNVLGQQGEWSDYKTNPTPATTGRILFPVLVIPNNPNVNKTSCLDIKSGAPRCSTIYSAQSSFYEAIDMRFGLTGPHTYKWNESVSFGREGAEIFAYNGTKVTVDCLGHRCFAYCPEPLYTKDMVKRCFPPSVLTGLTFRNARTVGNKEGGAVLRVIAAVDPQQRRNMIIRNCIFEENSVASGDGGALWIKAKRGRAAVHIIDSLFRNNRVAAGNGGALAIDGTDLNIRSTRFESNTATKASVDSRTTSLTTRHSSTPDDDDAAGAASNNTSNRTSRLPIIEIDMTGNGGAMAIVASDIGSVVNVERCTFQWNRAQGLGGGVYVRESKFVVLLTKISQFTMDENTANMGGNIYGESSEIEFADNIDQPPIGIAATLKNGVAERFGGSIACIGSVMRLRRTALNTNEAGLDGGGVYGILCMATIELTEVKLNIAARTGGGVYFSSLSTLLLADSELDNNRATGSGGAVGVDNCRKVHVFASRLFQNDAAEGAGLHFMKILLPPIVEESEIYENHALEGGGGGILWSGTMPVTAGRVVINRNEGYYGKNIASDVVALISSVRSGDVIACTNIHPFNPEISITVIDYYNNTVRRKNMATTVVATASSGECMHRPGNACTESSQSLFGKTVQEISGLLGHVNFTALGIRGWPGVHTVSFDVLGIPTLKRTVSVADCEQGYFLKIEGAGGACLQCPSGWHKNDTGIHSCHLCQAGFSCLVGSSFPAACSEGTFGPRTGMQLCQDCEEGQYQFQPQQIVCQSCPAGFSQPVMRSIDCDPCEIGYHGPQPKLVLCQGCISGQYTSEVGQSFCDECPVGYAQYNDTSSVCNGCAKGMYAKSEGMSTCEVCELGTVAVAVNSPACAICNKGRYANKTLGCLVCPAGYVSQRDKEEICQECGKGLFAEKTNQASCDECPAGYIAETFAQYSCKECSGGRYSALSASQSCIDCSPGKRTSTKAPTTCGDCPAGQSASAALATSCFTCRSGTYAPEKSMPACLLCPGGWSAQSNKSLHCDPCQAGEACPTASSVPFACPSGWMSPIDQSTVCQACAAGKSASGDKNTNCFTCLPGKYAPVDNSSTCFSCTPGKYTDVELSLHCTDCPQGWKTNRSNSPKCEQCAVGNQSYPTRPRGMYEQPGLDRGTGCNSCMLGWIQTPNTRTCWECHVGMYSLYRGEQLPTKFATAKKGQEDEALCHLCPEGAVCDGAYRVKALNSWWRSSNMSVNLTQCFEHAACLGAKNSNYGSINLEKEQAQKENNESCAEGYRGRLCHRCASGYGRETFDSCMMCPPSESNVVLMGLGIFSVIMVLILFVVFTVRTGNEEESSASMMFKTLAAYGQVVGIASLFPYRWPKSVLVLFDTLEMMTSVSDRFLNTDCTLEDDDNRAIPLTYQKGIMYMAGPLGFMLGATIFWLVVHCVMRCLFIRNGGQSKKNRDSLRLKKKKKKTKKAKSLDAVVHQAVKEKRKNRQLEMSRIAGTGTKGSNKLFFQPPPKAPTKKLKLSSSDHSAIDWEWRHTKRYLVVSIIITMVILHPTLTRQSLFLFMCTKIEGKYYLRKDVQLECFTTQHYLYSFFVGLPGVLLYVCGTPLLTLWVLFRRRHKLLSTGIAGAETRGTYGFLYRGYKLYYWEIVIMSRKISMVIVAVFGLQASVETQALLALLVVVLASAAHVIAKPYSEQFVVLDHLETAGLITAFITLYFGMFFFTKDVEENHDWLTFVTVVILASNFLFVTYWSVMLYGALRNEVYCVHRCDTVCRLSYKRLKSYVRFRTQQSVCCQRLYCICCCCCQYRDRKRRAQKKKLRRKKLVTQYSFDPDDARNENTRTIAQGLSRIDSNVWGDHKKKRGSKTNKHKGGPTKRRSKQALELAPIPLPRQFQERRRKLAQSTANADALLELSSQRRLILNKNDGSLAQKRFSKTSKIGQQLISLSSRSKRTVQRKQELFSLPASLPGPPRTNPLYTMKKMNEEIPAPPPALPGPPLMTPPQVLIHHSDPTVAHGWVAFEDEDGDTYYFHEATNQTSLHLPLPDGWEVKKDEDGDVYYYHEATDETSWEAPLPSLSCRSSFLALTEESANARARWQKVLRSTKAVAKFTVMKGKTWKQRKRKKQRQRQRQREMTKQQNEFNHATAKDDEMNLGMDMNNDNKEIEMMEVTAPIPHTRHGRRKKLGRQHRSNATKQQYEFNPATSKDGDLNLGADVDMATGMAMDMDINMNMGMNDDKKIEMMEVMIPITRTSTAHVHVNPMRRVQIQKQQFPKVSKQQRQLNLVTPKDEEMEMEMEMAGLMKPMEKTTTTSFVNPMHKLARLK